MCGGGNGGKRKLKPSSKWESAKGIWGMCVGEWALELCTEVFMHIERERDFCEQWYYMCSVLVNISSIFQAFHKSVFFIEQRSKYLSTVV